MPSSNHRFLGRILGSCLLALVTIAVTFQGARASASTKSQLQGVCQVLLGAPASQMNVASRVNLSQAHRIKNFLASLSADQKAQLYASLKEVNFEQLSLKLSTGQGIAKYDAQFADKPELVAVLSDIIDFGNHFPGIFTMNNVDTMVDQILDVVTSEEGRVKGIAGGDLLESQSMTARLTMTINGTLVNLIQQVDAEKNGATFKRTFMQRLWYKFKLFMFPAYSRVVRLINTGQEYQMQLSRLRTVDRLILESSLADANALGLTREELAQLTYLVLNSPDEIKSIEQGLKKVYGKEFAIGHTVEIGNFDLFTANSKAKEIDFGGLWESFDTANIDALNTLAKVLNAANVRAGRPERTQKDYRSQEIQLRHEAASRRVGYYHEQYLGWTNVTANESYTVERKRYREVPDGVDSKGNPKTRTETYYVDDTVEPSFENILSDSYDEGDRSVSGLSSIRERAAAVVRSESGPRSALASLGGYADWIAENYRAAMTTGKEKDKITADGRKVLAELKRQIEFQSQYMKKSATEIKGQYGRDDVKNFQARNDWILHRLNNGIAFVEMTLEGARRGMLDLSPAYDLMDFTDWLRNIRRTRNANYTIKTGMVTTALAAGAYAVSPDVQMFVQSYTGISFYDVVNMFHALRPPY